MEEILHPQQIMNRMRHQILDRHEHTWTHDEEGEKKHTTHKYISKRHMKNTQSKSKKQTFHQMWFFVLWFLFAFFHTTKTHVWFFADTLRKLLNSNGGASEPNIQKHICPELSTCNNSPQVEVKMVGKRQALILFVEKPTKKQKKHTFLHIIHTFSGRFCCCKGSIFGASPSGSPTNRLGKTDPTWRIGKGKNGNFLTNHQWRAGSGELESWRAQKGLRPSPKASLPTWICRDGVTVSHQKKTRM